MLCIALSKKLLNSDLGLKVEVCDQEFINRLHKAEVSFGAKVEPIFCDESSHIRWELKQSMVHKR